MIEIIYEKEKQTPEGNEGFFRIPNNIRQIGEVGGTQKIYIEDYAYTYLCRISSENSDKGTSAILLGQVNWKNGASYLFIKSAIVLSDMEVSEEHIAFTPGIWNHVYEKNKEYFAEQEVVGWCLSIPGCSMELHEVICKTHLDHFGGNDKVLFVMEPLEKEEAFYRYEEGKMQRQSGFYIYYEKNEPMRNYLISQNERLEQKSEEVDDSAVSTFRKKVENKNEREGKKQQNPVMKNACIGAAAMLLAAGVLYMNNYNRLKNTQQVIAGIEADRDKEKNEAKKVLPVNGKLENETTGNETKIAEEQAGKTQESETTETIEKTENAEEKTKTEEASSAVHQTYTIRQGDTITRISIRNYGSPGKIKEICELNNIKENDLIYPGQKILLP